MGACVWVRAAVGAFVVLAAMACSSDPGDGCVASACDITDGQCQKAIFAATACAREQNGTAMPKVRTISVDEYRKELTDGQNAPTANDQTWTTALQLLGFLPAGKSIGDASTDTSASDVAAFYDTDTKSVTVIDRGASDQQQDLFILSHEFVHSLQDAKTGLDAFEQKWAHSTDSDIAVHALVEGEAVVLSSGVLSRSVGRDPHDTNWPALESSFFDSIFASIDSAGAPFLTAVESLPYPVGSSGLLKPWLDSGQPGIDAFYAHPRQSLVDWTGDVTLGSTSVEPIGCYPTAAPPDYGGVDHDTFGIAGAMIVFMGSGGNARSAYDASSGWRNDSVVTFAPGDAADAGRAVAWRTHWDSPASAAMFQAAAQRALPAAVTAVDDADVTVRVASTPEVLMQWDGTACGAESDLPVAPPSATDTMTSVIGRARWRLVPSP